MAGPEERQAQLVSQLEALGNELASLEEKRRELVLEAHAAEVPIAVIARLVGLSRPTIYTLLRQEPHLARGAGSPAD